MFVSHTRTVVRECSKGDDASQWGNTPHTMGRVTASLKFWAPTEHLQQPNSAR